MDPLKEPPVAAGGKGQVVVVRQAVRPVPAEDAHGEVLVNDDHCRAAVSVSVVGGRTEERVGVSIRIEGGLELLDQVTGGHSAEQLFPLGA